MKYFQVSIDARGDMYVEDGMVIDRASGTVWPVGLGDAAGAARLEGTHAVSASELAVIPNAESATVIGGSGRCVLVTGHDDFAGVWQAGRPGLWTKGGFVLAVTGPSSASISDATGEVATLTAGGSAPAGSYVATEYGEDTYNGAAPFTLTVTTERGWPGSYLEIEVGVSAGTAAAGRYQTTDGITWASTLDPDWTITVAADGLAQYAYDGLVIATRPDGPNDDPCGFYRSEPAGEYLNADLPEPDPDDLAATNPFGTLTLTIHWGGTPDLDIGCTFLGDIAGYGHSTPSTGGPVGDYMTWTGDDTSAAGSETVVIDLAQAWDDGVISTVADIMFAADWYPPRNGSGPASIEVTYDLPGSPGTPVSHLVHPGAVSPSTTAVIALRVTDSGVQRVGMPWDATVMAFRRFPVAGIVYVTIEDDGSGVTGVSGPHFAESLPSGPASGQSHYPIATSDGSGGLKQIHTGPLVWAVGGAGGTGLALVSLTQAAYDSLDPKDPDTIYDITDAPWTP